MYGGSSSSTSIPSFAKTFFRLSLAFFIESHFLFSLSTIFWIGFLYLELFLFFGSQFIIFSIFALKKSVWSFNSFG
jgi:hypothetical protein